MRKLKIITFVTLVICFIIGGVVAARESYEDYRNDRYNYVRKDKPLSETGDQSQTEVMKDLREAIRDEIDSALSKERTASKKKIQDKSKFIRDIRRMIRSEIEEAINLKEKSYLSKGIMEVGGFFSFQATAIEGSEQDNNMILKFYPMFNYFFLNNLALQVRGGIDVNITTNTQEYYGLIGPQFAFGMDRRDRFVFYSIFLVGVTYRTALSEPMGYRFANDFGIKFVLSSGVALNIGLMIAFDNAGSDVQGFQDLFIPGLGITAWF